MKQIIREAFTDCNGKISAKRISFYCLLITFLINVFCNLFSEGNKNILNPAIEADLFKLLVVAFTYIFGEKAINSIGVVKTTSMPV